MPTFSPAMHILQYGWLQKQYNKYIIKRFLFFSFVLSVLFKAVPIPPIEDRLTAKPLSRFDVSCGTHFIFRLAVTFRVPGFWDGSPNLRRLQTKFRLLPASGGAVDAMWAYYGFDIFLMG